MIANIQKFADGIYVARGKQPDQFSPLPDLCLDTYPGITFVANVYNELATPEFGATLLGLLGISAGMYVGFKLSETKAQ